MTTSSPTTAPTPVAAFEVTKGSLDVLVLSEDAVQESLDVAELLDALSGGFAACERGLVQSPGRQGVAVPSKVFR